ncbi:putative membrane protein [Bacillus mesophilus]|uniref:DUF2339 domain-containing protein n=1 Tax=Bacillus mesophilus TaxID=1808955 RepID=A0A6M0Q932_9BACI|nr:DUF2339 domain-containing protein [Bacillus mesophilus]MBM7661892.1 putative membrane protein [Bacillus mesophilus]NEY72747.1 DUF2339 domain-containing protein [Bacillus mesophilus]
MNKEQITSLERRLVALEKEATDLKVEILKLKNNTILEEADLDQANKKVEQELIRPTLPRGKDAKKEQVDWEKQIGQIWLPRIFIFVLLLGIVWGFKAASDYGLLNDLVKVAIGFLSAILLFVLGRQQIKKKREGLGQVLLGGSIVLLLIVTFAAHVLYGLIPSIPALMLNIIWVSIGISVAHYYESEPLAILTGIGGYLIPFLLENQDQNVANFVLFETIFYIVLLLFALKKKFTILYLVAFGLLHVTLLAGSLLIRPDDLKIFGLAVLIQHLVLFIGFFMKSWFIDRQIAILFTSSILTISWLKVAFTNSQFELIILTIFIIYAILSVYFWSRDKIRVSATLAISTISLFVWFLTRFDANHITGLLLLQGLFTLYLGIITSSKLSQAIGMVLYICNFFMVLSTPFEDVTSIQFINWLILLGSVILISKLLRNHEIIKDRIKFIMMTKITTLILTLLFITFTMQALTADMSMNLQYMAVSFAWAIYALMLIMFGATKGDKVFRIFGLVLLFVTLAKLILIDLAYISIVIRAILFIGIGLIGVAGSRIFYKSTPK